MLMFLIARNIKFEAFKAMKMMIVFWVVTTCGLVRRYQYFGETYYLMLSLKMEAVCSSKSLVTAYPSTWNYNSEDQLQ